MYLIFQTVRHAMILEGKLKGGGKELDYSHFEPLWTLVRQ